jgi:ribA/ribD-fused uncharacterized protein
MNKCSYFIPEKALFGGYPNNFEVRELEDNGVRYFVDLTCPCEELPLYRHTCKKIKYPIVDRKTPKNMMKFSKFILELCDIITKLNDNEKIYIHCRGGHGRSGIVVASILCYLLKIYPSKALELTTECHSQRKIMKDKWRKIGSPQTTPQKYFVIRMFKPLYFSRACITGSTVGFSNFSKHSVTLPDLGTFPSSEAAYQAHKNPEDKNYLQTLQNSPNPRSSRLIGNKCKVDFMSNRTRETAMNTVLKYKFEQNEEIKIKLMSTGLRPIFFRTKYDNFFGDGADGFGANILGILLTEIRNSYYRNI